MSTKLLTVFQSLSWTFEIKKGTATNEDPVVHIYTNQPETLSLLSIVVPQFQRLCIWWDIYSWCTEWRMTKFRRFQSEELQFCTILVPFRMFWFFLGGFAINFFFSPRILQQRNSDRSCTGINRGTENIYGLDGYARLMISTTIRKMWFF